MAVSALLEAKAGAGGAQGLSRARTDTADPGGLEQELARRKAANSAGFQIASHPAGQKTSRELLPASTGVL